MHIALELQYSFDPISYNILSLRTFELFQVFQYLCYDVVSIPVVDVRLVSGVAMEVTGALGWRTEATTDIPGASNGGILRHRSSR